MLISFPRAYFLPFPQGRIYGGIFTPGVESGVILVLDLDPRQRLALPSQVRNICTVIANTLTPKSLCLFQPSCRKNIFGFLTSATWGVILLCPCPLGCPTNFRNQNLKNIFDHQLCLYVINPNILKTDFYLLIWGRAATFSISPLFAFFAF